MSDDSYTEVSEEGWGSRFGGSLAGAFVGLLMFLVAAPLTLLTVALSWLAFRPRIGGGLLVAAVVLAVVIRLIPRRSVIRTQPAV